MIKVRNKGEIFHAREDWFEGYWHFSFGGPQGFFDPENTSFGTLRVFNVDTLAPGAVWPLHPHQDIEVITYALDGEFQHGDQRGKGGILYPGDVQHTTVGKGIFHEEINHSKEEPMTFLQIWIMPRELGLEPSLEQRRVSRDERLNRFLSLVSNRDDGALPIQQDAEFLAAALDPGKGATHELEPGYGAYLYVAHGRVELEGHSLAEGAAAKIVDEPLVEIRAAEESELAMVVVRV